MSLQGNQNSNSVSSSKSNDIDYNVEIMHTAFRLLHVMLTRRYIDKEDKEKEQKELIASIEKQIEEKEKPVDHIARDGEMPLGIRELKTAENMRQIEATALRKKLHTERMTLGSILKQEQLEVVGYDFAKHPQIIDYDETGLFLDQSIQYCKDCLLCVDDSMDLTCELNAVYLRDLGTRPQSGKYSGKINTANVLVNMLYSRVTMKIPDHVVSVSKNRTIPPNKTYVSMIDIILELTKDVMTRLGMRTKFIVKKYKNRHRSTNKIHLLSLLASEIKKVSKNKKTGFVIAEDTDSAPTAPVRETVLNSPPLSCIDLLNSEIEDMVIAVTQKNNNNNRNEKLIRKEPSNSAGEPKTAFDIPKFYGGGGDLIGGFSVSMFNRSGCNKMKNVYQNLLALKSALREQQISLDDVISDEYRTDKDGGDTTPAKAKLSDTEKIMLKLIEKNKTQWNYYSSDSSVPAVINMVEQAKSMMSSLII